MAVFNLPEQWTINYKDLTFNLKPLALNTQDFFLNRLLIGTGFLKKSEMPDVLLKF